MLCSRCGAENPTAAGACRKCGADLSVGYIHADAGSSSGQGSPALWNPNAAANWSLLFSSAFGAYLQMLNWRALGEPEKAAASQRWFFGSLAVFGFCVLLGVFMEESKAADALTRLLGFTLLVTWYFVSGRSQAKYVKAKFGDSYPRKPWGKALLIGVGGMVGFFVVAVVIGFVLGVADQF